MLMNEFYNRDCVPSMRVMPDNFFDLAIVDPPYGINFCKTHTGPGWVQREAKCWDDSIPDKEYFDELFRVSKNQIIWGGNYMTEHLPPSMGWIVWNKMQRDFSLADGELAWTSFDRALRIFDFARGSALADAKQDFGKIHPTQKPIALYKWILKNYAQPGDKILDTHVGSASSLIACYEMNFDYMGFEIDEEYYNMAVKRIADNKAQVRMEL